MHSPVANVNKPMSKKEKPKAVQSEKKKRKSDDAKVGVTPTKTKRGMQTPKQKATLKEKTRKRGKM